MHTWTVEKKAQVLSEACRLNGEQLTAYLQGEGVKLARLDNVLHNIRYSTYVASFSEHEADDETYGKLSMWRAFGDTPGGRAALVFSVPWFTGAVEALKVIFSPVAYVRKEDVSAELDAIIRCLNERADFIRTFPTQVVTGMIFAMLLAAVTCVKHRGFFEEREWRVIYSPLIQGMHSPLVEQAKECIHGIPQLVQKLPLDARVPAAAELDVASLFDHLIIGPTQYPMPIAHACITALESAGISDPAKKITISDIPIRTRRDRYRRGRLLRVKARLRSMQSAGQQQKVPPAVIRLRLFRLAICLRFQDRRPPLSYAPIFGGPVGFLPKLAVRHA